MSETQNISNQFNKTLVFNKTLDQWPGTLGDECLEPSSWWTPEMVMIRDEPQLPDDLVTYCTYKPDTEREYNGWHFFAPSHVFRLPDEEEYIIAQIGKHKKLVFNIQEKTWEIMTDNKRDALDRSLFNIMKKM